MKINYLSVTHDGTGYSAAANNTILALDAVLPNGSVSVSKVKLATQTVLPPKRVLELEKVQPDNVDVVIQNILCPYFLYKKGVKNIGYFYWETDNIFNSGWQYQCNLMDKIWVSCEMNKQACIKGGVKVPIEVVPIPCDKAKYAKEYKKISWKGYDSAFKFYHIGDYSTRKNVANLIKSYFEAFSKADNVLLVLKCYVEATNPQESLKIITEDIQKIKASLRKYSVDSYPPIVVMTDYFDNETIMRIHASCDCFISFERGAAWNLPAFDAIAMNKQCIINGWGGPQEFATPHNSHLLSYTMTPVYGMNRTPYPTLYTCNEMWAEPDYEEAKGYMRYCYGNKNPNTNDLADKFSFENCGRKILELI